MRSFSNRKLRHLGGLLLLLLVPLVSAPVRGQTAEQIEIFQNLPPEQQRAILEALARSQNGTLPQTSESLRTQIPEIPILPPEDEEEETTEAGVPKLRPRSTVLIELRITRYEGEERVLVEPPPVLPLLPSGGLLPEGQLVPAPGQVLSTPTPATPARPAEPRVPIERTAIQTERLERLQEQVRRGNPYRIDHDGYLNLPGVAPILLSGLTEFEAAQRLAAEPYLKDFAIDLVKLPVEPAGVEALKPFGYDLFKRTDRTFAPVTDIPVPQEYVVGPGDTLRLQLLGSTRGDHVLIVDRDGAVNLPDLGRVEVAGLHFDDARAVIQDRVESEMIGTRASVTMGELRSIRVFVLGDAERPGSYLVSGFSTITNALYMSGGIKTIGSLRNIQLKRSGRLVGRLDLYDLLLNGDTSDDARLQPGDVIFIPPVGMTVGIGGEVNRPAIYEVTGSATVGDVLRLAGGLTPEADQQASRLERIDDRRVRTVMDVNLGSSTRNTAVRSGDTLYVPRVRPTLTGSVLLEGHVYHPGSYEYRPGTRLSDVLTDVEQLKPDADLNYVLIRRERAGDRHVSVISANLTAALRAPGTASDPLLAERDRIHVFDTATSRARVVDPLIEELERQGTPEVPSAIASIAGRIKVPGSYPLEPGMRISDLVRAGGGLDVSAYRNDAELTRYEIIGGEKRDATVIDVDLHRALSGDPEADIELRSFDVLVVKEISEWSELEYVTLEGEFRFPGSYPIKRGETLRSVIDRAGGLTELAFIEGSVFTRFDLREREQKQLQVLAERLQRDLAALALQAAQSSPQGATQAGEAVAIGQGLLADLRDTQAVGRLVINLEEVLRDAPGSARDIVLRNGDRLAIPKRAQEVTVIGEVQTLTSHLYNSDLARDDYIAQSGGTTQKADKSRIFVIRADGSVDAGYSNNWFARASDSEIRPGDTIVVPLDAERMRPLPLWTAVTTIIYNLAVAVAAVNSF